MHKTVEDGIRGGISMIVHRHAVADNPLVRPDKWEGLRAEYSHELAMWIVYLDANNLYGAAMAQALPIDGYRWETPESFDVNIDTTGERGYIVRVDLEYPRELHDLHNMYPLAPERMAVDEAMLTPVQKAWLTRNGSGHVPCEKLVPNLQGKTNYVVSLPVLQLYMRLGMRVTKVTQVISYRQGRWLEPYITMNTELRKKARNDFEKDLFKLANNSVFGKTMENVRAREEVRLVLDDDQKTYNRLVAKPTYTGRFMQVNRGLGALRMTKSCVHLNKPIAVGFTILDLSKAHMYRFHYEVMLPRYGVDRLQLLFTDTDSLCYSVRTANIYADMQEMKSLMDLSEYPKDSPYYDPANAKVLGMMKDETKGDPIVEFIGLKPKMYAFATLGGKKGTKAKGTKKCNVEQMRIDRYRNVLLSGSLDRETQTRLVSRGHAIHLQELRKTALSSFDDKRAIMEDGISTLAWGHYKLVP
jgi:hypothetical protein